MHAIAYKIVPRDLWEEAERIGRFDGSPVDRTDGYIHLSSTTQVVETANRHYAGKDELLLVTVALDPLGAALRWEPSRGGDLFPHIYGPLPLSAVTAVRPLPLGADGRHVFPPLEPAP